MTTSQSKSIKVISRIDAIYKDKMTVAQALKAIDDYLKPEADRLGVHWGFYSWWIVDDLDKNRQRGGRSKELYEAYQRPFPEYFGVLVRGGENEGWMIDLMALEYVQATATAFQQRNVPRLIGTCKVISSRDDVWEYARLVGIAAGL